MYASQIVGDAVEEKMSQTENAQEETSNEQVQDVTDEKATSVALDVFIARKAGMTRVFDENNAAVLMNLMPRV